GEVRLFRDLSSVEAGAAPHDLLGCTDDNINDRCLEDLQNLVDDASRTILSADAECRSALEFETQSLDELAFWCDTFSKLPLADPCGPMMLEHEPEVLFCERTQEFMISVSEENRLVQFVLRGCGRIWKDELLLRYNNIEPDKWLRDQLTPATGVHNGTQV
ncbi:unnamed protein product, partial [Amoebophrya sp. A25]